ncbi:recombinase family protein [Oryzobacter sp. R7]|uniref:recombinase family protein n=1 Tax=Oryzobacter faecalis TaxID=3388656 RepID=UPI00398C8420
MNDKSDRAVIYARISEDTSGKRLGVEDQLRNCRTLAELRGLVVVEEVSDNDISALAGKVRPGYERVLDLVRDGAVDRVVVWQSSRLWRNREERAAAIGLFGRQRVSVTSVQGLDLDLSTAQGRGMAGIMGEQDTMESEIKSERVTAAAERRARAGEPNGGLGYGWVKVDGRWQVEPVEAAVVREVVERLANREALKAVTADLNDREIPSPEAAMWARLDEEERARRLSKGRREPSGLWGKTSVKKLAIRHSNVGLRVHHKGAPDERVVDGTWPALVEKPAWEAARKILTAPERRTNGVARPGARRHLLTWGVGECGVCGGRLRVVRKGRRHATHTTQVLYLCESKECVGRNQQRVDELVRAVVLERLSRPDALDWLMGDEDAARAADERVREYQARLSAAGVMFARGAITQGTLEAITAELRPEIEAATAERDRAIGSRDLAVLTELVGPAAEAAWDRMSVTQQRAVLEVLRVRVVIDRARRGPGFDPASVRFAWGRAAV